MPDKNSPIGLFDSGVGGLTVFKALEKRLPNESLIYFGDTARLPYGTKSAETITGYALECADFLVARGVKLIVVACNSASAVAMPALKERYEVPVIGVVEAGAEAAMESTVSGSIGVLGTEGTIKSGAYLKLLKSKNEKVQVISQPCPLFVPLVEEGWIDDPVTEQVAMRYLKPLISTLENAACAQRIDTVVLGCTHYPLLKALLGRILGEEIRLVDSAHVLAEKTERLLNDQKIARGTGEPEKGFFVSDLNDRFLRIAERILGRSIDCITTVSPNSNEGSYGQGQEKRVV